MHTDFEYKFRRQTFYNVETDKIEELHYPVPSCEELKKIIKVMLKMNLSSNEAIEYLLNRNTKMKQLDIEEVLQDIHKIKQLRGI